MVRLPSKNSDDEISYENGIIAYYNQYSDSKSSKPFLAFQGSQIFDAWEFFLFERYAAFFLSVGH